MTSRYARHEMLPFWGAEGQQRLAKAAALIVGCGALGSHQAQLLARAGVGRLVIVDRDRAELHNLQRQVLYDEDDVASGEPKAHLAGRKLRRINSEIVIETHDVEVGAGNIEALLADVDVALDAADNFEVRFILNDACVKHGKPWIYGGIVGTEGLMMPIRPGAGPCLRCALPEKPAAGALPTGETDGILNSAPAVIAALQVVEALKILLGVAGPPDGMLHVDLWRGRFHTMTVRRHANCPTCGRRRFEFLERAR